MAEAATAKGAEIAVELVVDSISTQLGYIWNYRTNFDNLKRQHEKLEGTRVQVQHSVKEATRNGEEIEQKVVSWLDSVEKINAETTKIIEDNQRANMRCFRSLCPDLKKCYQHSKKAAVKGMKVSKLEKEGKFDKVSYRNPPKETWHPSSKLYQDIESRRSIVENILNALRNPDINMVGVHGMGGIGKTTLAKEVGKQAEEQTLFDALVFVEVSEKPDIRKIQGAIADKLGLKFHEETESGRARALCQRCKKESKLLIILDNIWKGLDLEIVGIPFANDHPGCKLLLTARSIDVLSNDMNSLKNFPVHRLDDKEAQDLFMKVAGACIEQHGLQSLALDVAKECGGLPIAIVTVAKALKDKQEFEWKSALHELHHPSVESLKDYVATEAYLCIKLSYDHLKSEELKSIFLLCSTLIFISNASVEGLLRYAVGLHLFSTINTMEAARDRVNTLIQKLKKSCLLLDTSEGEFFFMHDVVRDVGISIARQDQHMFTMKENLVIQDLAEENTLKNCTSIILHDIAELPEKLDCPQLEILYMKPKTRLSKIHDNFFKGMPNLRVVHLIEMVLSPLPASFDLLKKLQTLYLHGCHLADTVDIGKMKNLKILVLSSNIKQVPEQIGELTRLKVLDLSKCSNLEVIPPNTISRLTQLEELYMPDMFDQWQVEGVEGERSNASLGELEHLSQLTALQIYIPDAELVPKGLLFRKLQRYRLYIGVDNWKCYSGHNASRLLKLKYDDANTSVEDGIIKQLKEIEELRLIGKQGVKNVIYELNRDGFPKLKHFDVRSNPELVYIVDFPKQSEPCVAFPHLQTLYLYWLSSLEKICHGQFSSPYSFCRLRTLEVYSCVKLKNIFSSSIARHLSQLQEIKVFYCENMEEIFSIVGSENEEIVLEKLDTLSLGRLPKLRSFSYEEEVGSTCDEERQMKDTLMPLFDGKVKFRNLKTIYLWEINLKYVFSSSTLGSFVQLQRLRIDNCRVLEEIIRIDDLKNNVELPSLKTLQIKGCPQMKSFICSDKVTFPSLEEIEISDMDNLEMIWHNQLEDSLNVQNCQKLCKVSVKKCQSLQNLFPASIVRNLWQLKDIYVKECGIKEIVAKEEAGDKMFVFPELTSLSFHNLLELKCFYPGIHTTKWPMLNKLNIIGCDKIESSELFNIQEVISKDQLNIIAQEKVGNEYGDIEKVYGARGRSTHVECNSLITLMPTSASFQNLGYMEISGCNGLRNLVTTAVAKSLVQLERMRIKNCNGMTEIVANGDVKEDEIIFNKLRTLELTDLSNLTSFYSGNYTLNFPSLNELRVTRCSKMKFFSSGISSTPMLQQIKWGWSMYILEGDLNTTIQRIHEGMPNTMISFEEGSRINTSIGSGNNEIGDVEPSSVSGGSKRKRETSFIWGYMTRVDVDGVKKAKCNFCEKLNGC
ncbi:hypothetical protein EZV62_004492 [Acer yangbiense]|uniref:Uncharacterized protein n=1 Tax=Acer yangbiense TaxID=1000413 RepID=A0A5C7IJI7_9ROSI|nr:hypothetical protein EZV62_004492 [Acer yangbiense]